MFVVVRANSRVQYEDYELRLRATRDKIKAIIARITPVLNFIDGNLAPPLVGDLNINPFSPYLFVERCRVSLVNFRAYIHSVACTTAGHALVVVRSVYPMVSLDVVDTGFTARMKDDEAEQLMMEATKSSIRLVEDLDIFGDKEQQNQNN